MQSLSDIKRGPKFDNVLSRSDISNLLSLAAGDPAVDPGALFFVLSLLNDLHEPADLQRAAILLFLAPEKRPDADPWVKAWAEGAERLRRAPLEDIPEALKELPREALRLEAAMRLAAIRRQTAGLSGPTGFADDPQSPDAALDASPEGEAAARLGLEFRPSFNDPKSQYADSERALARALLRAQALELSNEPLAGKVLSVLIDIAEAHPCRRELLPYIRRSFRIEWTGAGKGPQKAAPDREGFSPEERLIAAGAEGPRELAERDLTAFLRSIGVIFGRDAETGAIYVEEWSVKGEAFARLAASLACWLRPNFRVRLCRGPSPVPCGNFLGSFNRALLVHSRSGCLTQSDCPDPIEALMPRSGKDVANSISVFELMRHLRF